MTTISPPLLDFDCLLTTLNDGAMDANRGNTVEKKSSRGNNVEEKPSGSNVREEKSGRSNNVEEKPSGSNVREEKSGRGNNVEEKSSCGNIREEKYSCGDIKEEKYICGIIREDKIRCGNTREYNSVGNTMVQSPADNKCDINLLCMACLCTDQKLNTISDVALQRFNSIVGDKQPSNLLNVPQRACWDCKRHFKKVIRFRQRVLQSYDILESGVPLCDVSYPPLRRLQMYNNVAVTIEPYNTCVVYKQDITAGTKGLLNPTNTPSKSQNVTPEIRQVDKSDWYSKTSKQEIKIEPEEMIKVEIEPEELNSATKHVEIESMRLHDVANVKCKSEEMDFDEIECLPDSNVCMTCLENRKLDYLTNNTMKQYYMDILNEKQISRAYDIDITPRLCWECLSVLKTSISFEIQVRKSYQALLPSLSMVKMQDISSQMLSGVSRPPRLRCHSAARVDIQPGGHADTQRETVGGAPSEPAVPTNSNPETRKLATETPTRSGMKPQCTVCSRTFKSYSGLKRHMKIHMGENPYKCSKCSNAFAHKANLKTHMKIHMTKKREKSYKCSVCPTAFTQKGNLSTHMKRHGIESSADGYLIKDGETMYQCSKCPKAFTSKVDLKLHKTQHIGESYQCNECTKSFLRKEHLVAHIRVHTGEKPYKCSECQKKFAQQTHLQRHTRIHTGVRPYMCQLCAKTFIQKPQLMVHLRTHTGEKPPQRAHTPRRKRTTVSTASYQCYVCSKEFNRRGTLRDHLLIHTGEKPNKCPYCEKAFTQKGHLYTHMRTHTGERPYRCSHCPKAYTSKGDLNKHIRTHSGINPFSCRYCTKTFSQKQCLVSHERKHTGDKPYKCDNCSQAFAHSASIRYHLKTCRPTMSSQLVAISMPLASD